MELSERCIAQLEKAGFSTIYEEKLVAGATFPLPISQMAVFVTEGSLLVLGVSARELLPGDRYRPSSGDTALEAGPSGCQLVIGE